MNADRLIIDDFAARQAAEDRRIPVTGTPGILLQAAAHGACDFPDTIQRLRSLGFWLSEATEAHVLKLYERERKQDD